MRLAQESIRIKADVTVTTPPDWRLVDVEGPFRLRFTVQPPTEKYRAYFRRQVQRHASAAAATQVGSEASLKMLGKEIRKGLSISDAESRRRQQKTHDITRTELVRGAWQIFSDGREVEMSSDDIDELFRVPDLDSRKYGWVQDGAAGYEPEDILGGDEVYRRLERDGEPLPDAVVRFVAFHSSRAERQRQEAEKTEVADPLPSTAGSTPGNKPEGPRIRSISPSGDSKTAESAADVAKVGSQADAADAKAQTA